MARFLQWRGTAWCAAAAVVIAVAAAQWRWEPGPERAPVPEKVSLGKSVVTVARGVHVLGETVPNASYVVETSDGLVLVDTCPEADAAPVLRQLAALSLDVSRLRAILLTHAHADHVLGAQRLRALTGAKVHAGADDCAVLRAGGPHEALFSVFWMPHAAHATDVDVELFDDDVITVGDTHFVAIATPGHTPGSTCYLLERDGRRILFTGDTVMSLTDEKPMTGAGTYPAYLSPRFRGDAHDTLASLEKLRAMPAPDLVLPGHPSADPVPQDPALPHERWDALLSRAIEKTKVLVGHLDADGADFLDGAAKELLPGLWYFGDRGGCAVYGLDAAPHGFVLFDAPGGPGLAKFVEESRRKLGLAEATPAAVFLTSCGPEAMSGLKDLVETTGCMVIAPYAGLDAVRRELRDGAVLRAAEAFAQDPWFPVVVVPLAGLEAPAAAYSVRWQSHTFVVTGAEPAKTTFENGIDLVRNTPWKGKDRERFRESLQALVSLAPDLWLPSLPVNDQNANVYGEEWQRILRANGEALR